MRFAPRLILLSVLALVASGLAGPAVAGPGLAAGPGEEAEPAETDETSLLVIRPRADLSVASAGLGLVPGLTVQDRLDELGLVRVEATAAAEAALRASGSIGEVAGNHPLSVFVDESTAIVEADAVAANGYDGTGSVIAVIDSGVDTSHSAFTGRIVGEACFLTSVGGFCPTGGVTSTAAGSAAPCVFPAADCAHGTHVAGIALSAAAPIEGVAPAAGLLAIRVMKDNDAGISSLDVLDALDHVLWLARSGMNIAAVNLSLGGSTSLCDNTSETAVWHDVAAALNAEGVAVVAASGNSADKPPIARETDVAFPACVDRYVSVGATERDVDEGWAPDEDPELTEFTQYGGGLDLVAPGFDIDSSIPGESTANFAGTSMAAPHVAGAFAVLDGTQPGWTPERYAELLRTTGAMIERQTGEAGDRHDRFPELRLLAAVGFDPFDDAIDGFWVVAADWAKFTGVSSGIGGDLYDPDSTLNRAQAVTFLWRLMGEPAPASLSSFPDVPPGQYYTAAVAWAAEQGITNGNNGLFLPDDPVTRGQMATFLWRLVGAPTGYPSAGFVDVLATLFYADAVDWMAATGITTGTSPTEFSPDGVVTRAQMITFVWRLVNRADAWSGGVVPPALAMF